MRDKIRERARYRTTLLTEAAYANPTVEFPGRRDRGRPIDMFRSSLLGLVYLVVGVAVAASHHYFKHLDTIRLILSAILAVVLWPLILLGIDLHIKK